MELYLHIYQTSKIYLEFYAIILCMILVDMEYNRW